MNYGHSSNLKYDDCYFNNQLHQSTQPLIYKLDTNAIFNEGQFLSTIGPRPSFMGNGVSTVINSNYIDRGHPVATAQYLTDVESILTNRNVHSSSCRNGNMNPANLTKMKCNHLTEYNRFLDPISTHLTHPPIKYREASIDRFYDLNNDPQRNIFWNFAVNTSLEAKDNFKFKMAQIPKYDPSVPTEYQPGKYQ